MNVSAENITSELCEALVEWLMEEGDARSTLAGAIVILEKLSNMGSVADDDVFTTSGQLVGGRGQALFAVLEKHGVAPGYLRDGVTTRSTEKFRRLLQALQYGHPLSNIDESERALLVARLVGLVNARIDMWFARQHLKVTCDRRLAPVSWIELILDAARDRSQGRVEQHLIGAKLEARLPGIGISRHAATTADMQTGREADFRTQRSTYHVTAAPSMGLMSKCGENLQEGLHPVVLVPRGAVERAKGLAEGNGLGGQISIFAIEDFVAQNVVELAEAKDLEFIEALRDIMAIYNERVSEAEIDKSLRIELR